MHINTRAQYPIYIMYMFFVYIHTTETIYASLLTKYRRKCANKTALLIPYFITCEYYLL